VSTVRNSRPDGEDTCRSCGAMIVWVRLVAANGEHRPHPLDSVPKSDGTIERKRGKTSGTWYGRVIPPVERNGRNLYRSHFATCPEAQAWRTS